MRFLFFILIISPFYCSSQLSTEQIAKIDSLKKEIKLSSNDTVVVNALKAWDDIIYSVDSDLDLRLNLKIDSISTRNLNRKSAESNRNFFLKSKGYATGNLGLIYNSLGENATALRYLDESLEVKSALKNESAVARILNNIGSIYHEQGVHSKAIEYYNKALDIHKKVGNMKGKAGALNNIAIIYRYQGEYETALKYYERSLSIKLETKDSAAIAVAYLNIGTLYNELKSFEKARNYIMKSFEISKKTGNKRQIALAYVNLGSIFHSENKLKDAVEYYLKGFAIQEAIDDSKMLAETAGYLGSVYFDLGNMSKARQYSERALRLSKENGVAQVSEQASGVLHRIYKKTGNYRGALEMFELNIELRDSINSKENQKAIIRQQFKYQYQKQADSLKADQEKRTALARAEQQRKDEIAAKDAEQKNTIIWSGAGGLVMILIFTSIVVKRLRITRKQKTIIQSQKEKVDFAYGELGKEKRKSDMLLLNILPEEVAEELKSTGESTPKHFKQATVLFTDFKGFTTVAKDTTPHDLVQTLNECFSAFDSIIEAHNMEKIKTIGDAYMCAGGVPIENTTNPSDAVKAASEMIVWINEWNKKRNQEGLPIWEIRIGIHTGELVAGVIGSKKFAYDVWGDAVNVASRMESYGEPGRINLSATTKSLIEDDFELEYRGEIEIKNRGSIGMYFVQT